MSEHLYLIVLKVFVVIAYSMFHFMFLYSVLVPLFLGFDFHKFANARTQQTINVEIFYYALVEVCVFFVWAYFEYLCTCLMVMVLGMWRVSGMYVQHWVFLYSKFEKGLQQGYEVYKFFFGVYGYWVGDSAMCHQH